ncbi:MAG: HIT family protein [Candidatus Poseidoniales archaeon]|nr:HIT family protein [Candidatus Poseidoniales archaeon]RJV01299.1 MAG: HIT family protein [Candidatus Poseidoniales archaeon]
MIHEIHPQYFEVEDSGQFMAEKTLFQKILSGEIPGNFIARGDNWASFLDVFPRAPGHTLVVPHSPVQRIADLSDNEITHLFEGVKQTQSILSSFFETEDFTVMVHDGPKAGQEIPHVHIHLIPRTEGDKGLALPAIFPNANPPNPPDFTHLASLCQQIKEASE